MKLRFLYFVLLNMMFLCVSAQTLYPSIDPQASYTTVEGETIDDATSGQNAPLAAHFTVNTSDQGDYKARYEWKIYRQGEEDSPIVHRLGDDMEELDYTFTLSGTFYVQVYATFVRYDAVAGNDTIQFPENGVPGPIQVTINESKLEFPNAFSPNEVPDGFNDELKAKDGYQSIVEFKAAVFNRWGQKLYSWTDVSKGWNGRINGHLVNDGVYFLVVNAKGADGRKYNIRKAITVITGYNKDSQNSTTGGGSGG